MRKLQSYGPSIIVLITAVVVLLGGPLAVEKLTFAHTNARIIQASQRLDNSSVLEQMNQAYRDIASLVEPSVVHISTERHYIDRFGNTRTDGSSGSGWIFDVEGHIVTNYHVIKDAERIQVQLHNGQLRDAQIVGQDRFTDIAVIKIPSGMLHEAVLASPEDTVKQGDMVFAFGSPFDFRFSMSSGVVSGMGRYAGVIRDEFGRRNGYENFIQVDAAINPGNSGGPLTDIRGHVIGMNTAIATGRKSSLDEGQFAGIGLAIPLAMIQPVVEQIIDSGFVAKGYLGIGGDPLSDREIQKFELLGFTDGLGVKVTSVTKNEPAFTEGVKVGDIITHANDEVIDTFYQLRSVISSMRPGEIVRLKLWRYDYETKQGRTMTIPIALAQLNSNRVANLMPIEVLRSLGIERISTFTQKIADDKSITFSPGVMIDSIVPDSKLDEFAEPGYIITRVGDKSVHDIREFLGALSRYDLQKGVMIRIMNHEGGSFNVRLKIP